MASLMNRVETTGSVRIGPVTVISFVIILCLAVLAVLAVTTARVSSAEAERQAEFIRSTYSNEFTAQQYLADVDAALAKASAKGESVSKAMARVRAASPAAASVDGRIVSLAYQTELGRRLTLRLRVNDDLTYTVLQWTTSTEWIEEPQTEENLWSGE